jgi:hypothetical protein
MNMRSIIPRGRRLKILKRPPESILPSSPRPQRRDAHGRLIEALLKLAGPDSEATDASLRPWCSATFIGAQHELTLVLRGADAFNRAMALADALPKAEFRIPGHVVADLAVDELTHDKDGEASLRLTVLTIEAW